MDAAGSTRGVRVRRGDGTFGLLVPKQNPIKDPALAVPKGMVGLVHIGIEVKIVAKAWLKQIDRVITDLMSSADSLRTKSPDALVVGIGAVNYSEIYTGVEGTRAFDIDLKPAKVLREAEEASRRIERFAAPKFDEFLLFKFRATNRHPYPFAWINRAGVEADYAAALIRIAGLYEKRF